jgi:hypothetical protein
VEYELTIDERPVTAASYSFKSGSLRHSDGAWIVTLEGGEYRGSRFLVIPDISDILKLRITLPERLVNGGDYEIARRPSEGACTVEVLRRSPWLAWGGLASPAGECALGTWEILGPGALHVTDWSPDPPSVAGTLSILATVLGRTSSWTADEDASVHTYSYRGSFQAPHGD